MLTNALLPSLKVLPRLEARNQLKKPALSDAVDSILKQISYVITD